MRRQLSSSGSVVVAASVVIVCSAMNEVIRIAVKLGFGNWKNIIGGLPTSMVCVFGIVITGLLSTGINYY